MSKVTADPFGKFMLKEFIMLLLQIGFLVLAVVLTDAQEKKYADSYSRLTDLIVVSGEEGLQKAENGETQNYILDGIELSGTPVKDPTGSFSGDYYYFCVNRYDCCYHTHSDNENFTYENLEWDTYPHTEYDLKSKDLKVTCCDTNYFLDNVGKQPLNFNREDSLRKNLGDTFSYYPNGSDDIYDGNKYYSYMAIPVGTSYSAMIEAGNGTFKFLSYNGADIFFEGSGKNILSNLKEHDEDNVGVWGALSMLAILVIFAAMVFAAVNWIKERFDK